MKGLWPNYPTTMNNKDSTESTNTGGQTEFSNELPESAITTEEETSTNTPNNMKGETRDLDPELPVVLTFKALHIPENVERAKASLKGKSGIYCFRHITSGKKYIGQAVDLSVRIIQHLKGNSSNIPLQHALNKYGIWPGRARQHIMNHEYVIHNVCLCPA